MSYIDPNLQALRDEQAIEDQYAAEADALRRDAHYDELCNPPLISPRDALSPFNAGYPDVTRSVGARLISERAKAEISGDAMRRCEVRAALHLLSAVQAGRKPGNDIFCSPFSCGHRRGR